MSSKNIEEDLWSDQDAVKVSLAKDNNLFCVLQGLSGVFRRFISYFHRKKNGMDIARIA